MGQWNSITSSFKLNQGNQGNQGLAFQSILQPNQSKADGLDVEMLFHLISLHFIQIYSIEYIEYS